ncbi:TPA: glycosyltransferase [Photobacterium damselae]
MRRIIFYRPNLHCGGAERVIVNKANYYASIGYTVYILLKDDIIEFDLHPNIRIIILYDFKNPLIKKTCSLLQRVLGYYYYFISSFFISVSVYIKVYLLERDIGEFEKFFVHSNKAFMDLLYFKHKNKVIICHSNKSKLYSSSKYSYKRKIAKKIAILIFKREKEIIAVSRGIKEDLINNFNVPSTKIKVIYNPFDIPDILVKSNEDIKHSSKYIVHIGRISEEKRHYDLLDIYKGSLFFNTHDLLIVGDGVKKEELIDNINRLKLTDKVHLIGFQKNPYKYINNADALILCSEYEGFGNVLVEAGVLNTMAISSDCNYGPSELIKSDYLFPVGDTKAGITRLNSIYNIGNGNTLIKDVDSFSLKTICNEYLLK